MRFTVLGPLSVTKADGAVEIGAFKQRLLLATLLCQPGRVVDADTLIDVLWEEPPVDERKRLAWHVTKLRRVLDDGERIVRRGAGYLIDVSGCELDAVEFERSCTRGSRMADSDPLRANQILREALALWNGPAYGELAEYDPVRSSAAELDRLRQAALRARLDTDLALGRHHEVVAELHTLVAADPWHQEYRAQLMLALYRCGRPAEALGVYRQGRDRMIDELGIEPGPRLRGLERAVLRDDPALSAPAPARKRSGPAELPKSPVTFTGREAAVTWLRERLRPGAAAPIVITALEGAGGIGKSALAVHTATLMAGEFGDGQLYVNLRSTSLDGEPLRPDVALLRMLRSLGAATPDHPADVDELSARFRSATVDKRLLLVLDDAADAAQVAPLLPAGDGCAVVITSRHALACLDGAQRYHLDVLAATAATDLLRELVGARVAEQPAEAAAVAELCGRMPLALCVAAARMNANPEWTFAGLSERLATESQRLSELDDGERAVRSTFMVSYRNIDAEAARVFRLAGLPDGVDLTAPAVAALAGSSVAEARRQLDVLVASHLMDRPTAGRYRLHDLLRVFARERVFADEDDRTRDAAWTRLLHWNLATARNGLMCHSVTAHMRSRTRLAPDVPGSAGLALPDREHAHTWLNSEADNLVAFTRQSVRRGTQSAAALAAVLSPQLRVLGRWREALALGESAVAATEDDAESEHRYFAHVDLVTVHNDRNDYAAAIHHGHIALRVSAARGDRHGQLYAYKVLGDTHSMQGDFDTSVEFLRRALRLSRDVDSVLDESAVLINLGNLYFRMECYDDAIASWAQAIPIVRDHEHRFDHAVATGNTAHALTRLHRYAEAVEWFGAALELDRNAAQQDTRLESDHHWGLGEAHYALGDAEAARRAWRSSGRILHNLGLITGAEKRGIDTRRRPETPRVHQA